MENNDEQEINVNDQEYQDDNGENGEEVEENLGINYEGEYDGEEEQIDSNQEGQEEGMEEGQEEGMGEEAAYEGEEEAIEGGQEEGMEEAQEEAGEEAYEEQNEDNNKENEEGENNQTSIKPEEINKKEMDINNLDNVDNNNNKLQIENNNNFSSDKKDRSNKKRMEIIKNKLNWAQNNNNNKNENIIEKDVEEDNNDKNNYKTFNFNKKDDILTELLSKIQSLKYKKQTVGIKTNSNNNLDDLDKELAKGLQKLNKQNIEINLNNLNEEQKMNKPPQRYEREILRNPKFKEIISLINDKETTRNKGFRNLGKNDFVSYINKNKNIFSNINLYSPKINKYLVNTLENKSLGNNINKKYGNDKYYISCIDGKAIVNGMRKDIPFVSKFNNNDKLTNNKYNNNFVFVDLTNTYNNNIKYKGNSTRRNNSFNMNKLLNKNDFNYESSKTQKKRSIVSGTNDFNYDKLKNNFSKENLTNKLHRINDNYFTREFQFLK